MSDFEYDDDKSQANLEKHGIDFLNAQALWKDPDLLKIRASVVLRSSWNQGGDWHE